MKIQRRALVPILLAALAALGAAGCGKKKSEISELDRKKADFLASEAQFAMTLRNWAEAEKQLAEAVKLSPDDGAFWVNLGQVRKRLGRTGEAKDAYKRALEAFAAAAKEEPKDTGLWLRQVYVLAALGRTDDARAMLEKAAKQFPNDPDVRGFVDGKELDRMLADPKFKETAL